MTAIHATWVAPRLRGARQRGWSEDDLKHVPVIEPEDLVTMIFSALVWRKLHGPVVLFADSASMDFLGERGVLDLYDGTRSAEIDRIDQQRYAPDLYFSLPKLVALQASTVPVAVLDLDLFLRHPLPDQDPEEFVFAHHETLGRDIYPLLSDLPNPNNIRPQGLDDAVPACNMAVAAFGNQRHLDEYTDLAMAFMDGNGERAAVHQVARIAFAEQRLCAYTALRNGLRLRPFASSVWDADRMAWTDGPPEHLFHHTWHLKRYMDRNSAMRDRLCVRLIDELLRAFPEAARILERDPVLARLARDR